MRSRPAFDLRFADDSVLNLGARTAVMGVLNVTPDSFSDGGRYQDPAAAMVAAERMLEHGADLIDVGGESTRPGARPVDAEEESVRVAPVIEAIKRRHPTARVSVDTRKAAVARRALDAGADMINDVAGLRDPAMLPLLVERGVPAVLMHMRGTPQTMQQDTQYDDLLSAVATFLDGMAKTAVAAGMAGDKIVLDPGVGFGKSVSGSLILLQCLSELASLGHPLLVGASRKSFIGAALDLPVERRLEASLAVAAHAAGAGAHIVRAHDVAETVRAVRIIDVIHAPGSVGNQTLRGSG